MVRPGHPRRTRPIPAVNGPPPTRVDRQHHRSALWLWSSPEASRALRTRDLAVILHTYRQLNGLSQERLALLLGYDKTYISMIETRRRVISDIGTFPGVAGRVRHRRRRDDREPPAPLPRSGPARAAPPPR